MTIKTILVPLYGSEEEMTALEVAFLLAERFEAHIKGLHISAGIDISSYYDTFIPEAPPSSKRTRGRPNYNGCIYA